MRILIIGGTGFIGKFVAQQLLAKSHKIAIFHRGKTNTNLPKNVSYILGDRRNLTNYHSAFKQFSPQIVIDIIAYTEQEARDLVQAFRHVAERLVVVSCMDVYCAYEYFRGLEIDTPGQKQADENAPLREHLFPYRNLAKNPSDFLYNYEKTLVEKVVRNASDIPVTILRLSFVYGPGDNQNRLFDYLKRMDDHRPAILLDKEKAGWRCSRGYVENVAATIVLAAINEKATSRIYNVADTQAYSELEWIKMIGSVAGWQGKVVTVPQNLLPEHLVEHYDWRHHLEADTRRIRKELRYFERINTQEALARTIAWQHANPPKTFDKRRFDYAAEDIVLNNVYSLRVDL